MNVEVTLNDLTRAPRIGEGAHAIVLDLPLGVTRTGLVWIQREEDGRVVRYDVSVEVSAMVVEEARQTP